jgi:hypothetical protein
MNCREIAPLLDELVDGTLDPARASGVRGHARGCAACAARLAETEALVAGMQRLEPMDPPASLWAGIRSELDRAEAADAARPRWWWWWQGARKQVAWTGAAFAGAALCVSVWVGQKREAGVPTTTAAVEASAPVAPAVAAAAAAPMAVDEAVAEIQAADAEYQKAMAQLEQAVAAEKPRWRGEVAHAFDENLAVIDAAVEKQRAATRLRPDDLGALDALHAAYRKRIDFLQESVVRGGVTAAADDDKETL